MTDASSLSQTLGRAFALYEAGRLDEARRLARPLEKLRPEPAGLVYLLGLLALAEGQGRKAAQYLNRAIAHSPDQLPPRLAYLHAQRAQGRLPEALGAAQLILILAPDLASGWSEIGEILFAKQKFAAALPAWQAANRLRPDRATSCNNLGIALRAAGQSAASLGVFRAAICLDPGFAKPYANLAGLQRVQRQPARRIAERARQLEPLAASHAIESGQAAQQEGDLPAALEAFRAAATALPEHAEPIWLMAEALRQMGDIDEAAPHYRSLLRRDPSDPWGASLALARMGLIGMPDAASPAHVSALYDQYAASFEANLRGDLDYRAPELLRAELARMNLTKPLAILDAGCGTGLMGQAIKDWAGTLHGIDLSEKMLEQARSLGIYDQFERAELLTFLRDHPARYDLVIAADVLIYFGDLAPVTKAAFTSLKPGGIFAFTVEASPSEPFILQDNGRFAHGERHLRDCAEAASFQLTLCAAISTRREKNQPVAGYLCILTRP